MASVINGTNIVLYRFYPNTNTAVPFGAATNCSFETSVDQVEVTSQTSAWFREYKNDVITWSVTCDGLSHFLITTTMLTYCNWF